MSNNMMKTKRTAIKTIVSISIGLACFVSQGYAQASTMNVPFTDLILDGSPPANIHCKALGDINNDGRLDVVVASSAGEGMYWYANPGGDGSATWTKHTIFASGSWTTDMQVADVDGDGWPDIITAKDTDGDGKGDDVYWYKNPGNTGGDWIEYHIGFTGRGNGAHDVEVGDFNKDGKIDVAVNAGLFIQNNPDSWTFVDIGRGTEEGTGVGNTRRWLSGRGSSRGERLGNLV